MTYGDATPGQADTTVANARPTRNPVRTIRTVRQIGETLASEEGDPPRLANREPRKYPLYAASLQVPLHDFP